MSEQAPLQTFYDAVGGHETFVALVKRFYEGVASDPPLRALYPEPDLASAEERLRMCLTNDPALGVVRHADAGYELAIETARVRGMDMPSLS